MTLDVCNEHVAVKLVSTSVKVLAPHRCNLV
jgi:hypothetical protein